MSRVESRHWVGRSVFAPGARWRVVTRVHAGLEVEVMRVTHQSVTVQPVTARGHAGKAGKAAWSRQQRNDRWTVPLMRFLAGYRPL